MHLIGMHLIGVCIMGVHLMVVHHRMQPFLLSRTYVFAAFGGRWPGVISALSPIAPGIAGMPLVINLGGLWPPITNKAANSKVQRPTRIP